VTLFEADDNQAVKHPNFFLGLQSVPANYSNYP